MNYATIKWADVANGPGVRTQKDSRLTAAVFYGCLSVGITRPRQ